MAPDTSSDQHADTVRYRVGAEWDDEAGEYVAYEEEWNGRLCPYFARYNSLPGHDPEAVCTFGCRDEPQCVTCEPNGGWPELIDGDGCAD